MSGKCVWPEQALVPSALKSWYPDWMLLDRPAALVAENVQLGV
jgi:hypothetical protein